MTRAAPLSEKDFRVLACAAARAADDKKGEDILLLHVRPVTELADYMLLVGVTSPAHLGAIEEAVRLRLKEIGLHPCHRDGRSSELWRVLDYGGLLVHLMHPQAREFYQLDKLFHGARKVAWEARPGKGHA